MAFLYGICVAIISLHVSKASRIFINVTESVIYKKQSLKINCSSNTLSTYDIIDRISLSKIQYNSETLLVQGKYNPQNGQTIIQWYNRDFQDRAAVSSKIIQSFQGNLSAEIFGSRLECWDAAIYGCKIFFIGGTYGFQQKEVRIIRAYKYVETVVSSPVKLHKDKLDIECVTANFAQDDLVNQIILSKHKDYTTTKLIRLDLDFSTEVVKTFTHWYDQEFKSRAVLNIANIYPADKARLHVTIYADRVLCSDSGSYICEVYASHGKNGKSESSVNITVARYEYYTVTEQTCKESRGYYGVRHTAVLKCGGKVGNTPQILHWCRKLANDSVFHPYKDIENTAYTSFMSADCQYESYSTLEYMVSEEDTETTFMCASYEDMCKVTSPNKHYVIKRYGDHRSWYNDGCYRFVIETECSNSNKYTTAIVFLGFGCMVIIYVMYNMCR